MAKNKSVKTTVEQEKTTADKLAFNNAAVEAIAKNAATRDALRKKIKMKGLHYMHEEEQVEVQEVVVGLD
jgi:hypothetical protein